MRENDGIWGIGDVVREGVRRWVWGVMWEGMGDLSKLWKV